MFGDQQPLPNTTFAGKKGLVVDGSQNLRGIGAVRTPFWPSGRRVSGVRSDPQASRSQVLWICQSAPRGARVGPSRRKAIHVRLTSVSIALWRARGAPGCDVGVAGAEALDADAARYRAALISYIDIESNEQRRMPLPTVASGGMSLGNRKPNGSSSSANGLLEKRQCRCR